MVFVSTVAYLKFINTYQIVVDRYDRFYTLDYPSSSFLRPRTFYKQDEKSRELYHSLFFVACLTNIFQSVIQSKVHGLKEHLTIRDTVWSDSYYKCLEMGFETARKMLFSKNEIQRVK